MSYSQLMALAEQLRFCDTHSCLDCDLALDDSRCLVKNLGEIAELIEFLAELLAEEDDDMEEGEYLPF